MTTVVGIGILEIVELAMVIHLWKTKKTIINRNKSIKILKTSYRLCYDIISNASMKIKNITKITMKYFLKKNVLIFNKRHVHIKVNRKRKF